MHQSSVSKQNGKHFRARVLPLHKYILNRGISRRKLAPLIFTESPSLIYAESWDCNALHPIVAVAKGSHCGCIIQRLLCAQGTWGSNPTRPELLRLCYATTGRTINFMIHWVLLSSLECGTQAEWEAKTSLPGRVLTFDLSATVLENSSPDKVRH